MVEERYPSLKSDYQYTWLGGEPWDRSYRRSTKSKRLTLADYLLSNMFLLPYANTPFAQHAMYKPFVHSDWNKYSFVDQLEEQWALPQASTKMDNILSDSASEEVYIPIQPRNITMREKIDLNPLRLKM